MAQISVSYSESHVRLVIGSDRKARCIVHDLPPGTVRSSLILNTQAFADAVSEALSSAHIAISSKHVVTVGLPEEQAFIKIAELPRKLKPKEVENTITLQWQKFIPVPLEQVFYAYQKLPTSKKAEYQHVLLLAYPQESVEAILEAFQLLGITPQRLIPISFGMAEVFARDASPRFVLLKKHSGSVSVTIVQNKLSLFSTSLHTVIEQPNTILQLKNLKTYYEESLKGTDAITECIALGTDLSALVAPYVAEAGFTLTTVEGATYATTPDLPDGEREIFVPLIGLARSKSKLSIVPKQLQAFQEIQQQSKLLKFVLFYMSITLSIVFYFSLIFLLSLRFMSTSKSSYAPSIVEFSESNQAKLKEEVTAFNQAVSRLVSLKGSATKTGSIISAISTITAQSPGITVTGMTYESDKKTLTLIGTRQSKEQLTVYIERLKTEIKQYPELTTATVEASPESLQGDGAASFTVTITGVGQ